MPAVGTIYFNPFFTKQPYIARSPDLYFPQVQFSQFIDRDQHGEAAFVLLSIEHRDMQCDGRISLRSNKNIADDRTMRCNDLAYMLLVSDILSYHCIIVRIGKHDDTVRINPGERFEIILVIFIKPGQQPFAVRVNGYHILLLGQEGEIILIIIE